MLELAWEAALLSKSANEVSFRESVQGDSGCQPVRDSHECAVTADCEAGALRRRRPEDNGIVRISFPDMVDSACERVRA